MGTDQASKKRSDMMHPFENGDYIESCEMKASDSGKIQVRIFRSRRQAGQFL